MSTAPGSAPIDSCVMNASLLSGEYAMPCTIFFVVGMRATSASVRASNTLMLWSFLLVTITNLPSGEGSTL